MPFNIHIDANEKTLDAYKLHRITDGDTPFVEMPIRMLSIDTPEVHYPGTTKPSAHDAALRELGDALRAGKHPKLPTKLARYLARRLDARAGTRHLQQGQRSLVEYERMLVERMRTKSGGVRKLFVRTSAEIFEGHGRLLAYVAPMYPKDEAAKMTLHERRTFNLQLVEEGWAAPFLIYPSLPKGPEDLALFRECIRAARIEKRGHYADPKTLTGYELRFCVKLMRGEAQIPERSCADLASGKLHRPENYLDVVEEDRMFVWPRDVSHVKSAYGFEEA